MADISTRRAGRRAAALAILAVAATVGFAACGGSNAAHVVSLGTTSARTASTTANASGDSATTTSVKGSHTATTATGQATTKAPASGGDPTKLLNKWTACMRSHGDPNQAEPTIDVNGAIHVIDPAGYLGTIAGPTGHDSVGAGVSCLAYLTAASTALHGGEPLQGPDPATGDRFAACMRAHGVSNFPDPGAGAASVSPGSKPNAKSPSFEKAAKLCAQKHPGAASLGGPATLQPGQIEIDNATDGSVRLIFIGAT